MMYADIVPFVRLPRSQSTFTYAIPEALSVKEGAIVEIEFRKKRTYGCVVCVHTHTPRDFTAQELKAVLSEPTLTRDYCSLLDHVATITCTSPSIVYKDAVPIPPKGRRVGEIAPHPVQQSFATQKRGTAKLLLVSATADADMTIKNEMRAALKQRKQLLVLFPTHEHLALYARTLPRSLKQKTTAFHAQLGKRAYLDAWRNIEHGAPIVLGTRSGIFAPGTWDTIVLVHEEHPGFKQEDQNPRYSTHALAEYFRISRGTHVIFISSAPRVNTWWSATKRELSGNNERVIRLLDMRGARHEAGILHAESIQALEYAARQGQHVTIMIARGGYAGSTLCRDCGFTLVCDTCHRPYSASTQTTLACSVCRTSQPLPNVCPACHGSFFDFQGFGVGRIQHALERLFDNTDPPLLTITTNAHEIHPETTLVLVLSSEAMLHHPDFRASERTYQWLAEISARAQAFGARSMIQSWTPEHHVFTALVQKRPELFYTKEIGDRQSTLYPPFVRSALIIHKARTPHEGKQAADVLLSGLVAQTKKTDILMSEPYIRRGPSRDMVHTAIYVRQFIEREEPEFVEFLHNIPEPWIIDREPENIF